MQELEQVKESEFYNYVIKTNIREVPTITNNGQPKSAEDLSNFIRTFASVGYFVHVKDDSMFIIFKENVKSFKVTQNDE